MLHLPATAPASVAPTMSSREIADLVNSRHDDVKRSIERLAERGVIELPPMAEVANPGAGPKTIREYRVGKRDSYVVVAQLSPEFTARLVDRWQELEAAAASAATDFAIPASYAEALRLAADQAEKLAEQEAQISAMAPKAEFHDLVVDTVNTQDMNTVAKVLGTGRTRLFALLRRKRILMANNQPFQQYVDAGYFKVIELKPWKDASGQLHSSYKTVVTGKGLPFIQRIVSETRAAADDLLSWSPGAVQ